MKVDFRDVAGRLRGRGAASSRSAAYAVGVPLARVVVYGACAVLIVSGIRAVFGGPSDAGAVREQAVRSDWPSLEAEAVAERFVVAVLSGDVRRVGEFLSPSLEASQVVDRSDGSERPSVGNVSVVSATADGRRLARVTVQADVDGDTRYVSVRVARGDRGLAVTDFPAFVAGPAVADVDPTAYQDVEGDADAIAKLADKFFAAYLAGDGDPAYLAVPGADVRSPGRYGRVSVDQVQERSGDSGRTRELAVAVMATDESGAAYRLSYQLTVEKRDRWLVVRVAR